MANLSTLLAARIAPTRGTEDLRLGSIFYHALSENSGGLYFYPCQYCWKAPGNGCAVIELWGAAGGAAGMCCCSGGGLPGNPGAYSRRTVPVTSSSYVCGWVGYTQPSVSSCCNYSRSGCSVACLFSINTGNCLMIAQGGFEGIHACTTSTAGFCCLTGIGYCGTAAGSSCGTVCNVGGPSGAVGACSCGGDVNVCGGISCIEYWDTCNYYPESLMYTVAIPAGIYSTTASCLRIMGHNCNPGSSSGPGFSSNRLQYMIQLAGLSGSVHPGNIFMSCWSSVADCSCYQYVSCFSAGVALPGISNFTCGGQRVQGMRGGHGAVKITYYT